MARPPSTAAKGVQSFKVSSSGQLSLPAAARSRWGLQEGGRVDVVDVGFGVMILPAGGAADLLDDALSADEHHAFVADLDDPDLRTT